MPAEGIHQTALREAAAHPRLGTEARRCLVREEDAGRLGAVLLDLAYFDRYLEEVVRYAARRPPRTSRWGNVVHEEAAVPIAGSRQSVSVWSLTRPSTGSSIPSSTPSRGSTRTV
jgi:hypothetical protein